MGFQSSVRFDQAGGVPGEFATNAPHITEPGILQTQGVVGRFFSESPTKPGYWTQGGLTGATRIGLLTHPKQYASQGTVDGGTLAPTLILAANTNAEFTVTGQVWVATMSTSKPGDLVYMNNADGAVVTAAVGAAAPADSTLVPGAVVAPRPGAAMPPGIIVVTLNQLPATAVQA